ncbi:MAG: phasin family protein [Methylobacterium sp.]|jgi:hypothetical protein
MNSGQTTHPHAQSSIDPVETFGKGLNAWHTVIFGLPLRLAAETVRFTGRRLQAQADHLAALAQCGSLKDAVSLQTAFVTKGVSDYRDEAATLSQNVTETTFPRAA